MRTPPAQRSGLRWYLVFVGGRFASLRASMGSGDGGTAVRRQERRALCDLFAERGPSVLPHRLLERVGAPARRALGAEATRLTAWLDGVRIGTGYRSPAMNASATHRATSAG